MSQHFPHLFTPLNLGPLRVRNRIFIPGHATALSENSQVSDDLIAYHERRAANGVGLIITEVNVVHESAVYSPKYMQPNCQMLQSLCLCASSCAVEDHENYNVPSLQG